MATPAKGMGNRDEHRRDAPSSLDLGAAALHAFFSMHGELAADEMVKAAGFAESLAAIRACESFFQGARRAAG